MNFYVLTLFPEMVEQGLNTSIIGRALEKGLLSLKAVDIRDFSENKHNRVDDYPYGGGAGMVMAPGPVYRAHQYVEELIRTEKNSAEFTNGNHHTTEYDDINTINLCPKKTRVIYLTPQGSVFNQTMAEEFAKEEDLIFLCGHYEGIDERILEMIVTDYVSIGDYVLTGGELPSMVMIDAIARLVPGVLNNDVSAEFESFQDNLLEYPQYTRPEVFMEKSVPDILLSGHHAKIEEWRKQQSILRTAKTRPDLLEKAVLTVREKKFLFDYLNKPVE
ncbi:tRNA (guanosine(37)-N1)-methyltransferase TrmD [Anaerocolumna sp. MB42-C2]|uniref:tRNA (guanosine(37)-N1)-methyltransferase TrmD n=1 Tax=Anaerocolumna sp. MB42-C2 TaxID=3070997 RepID=UPI0027E1B7E2|nr:tRNA (guanosine(37)-N1)-methyltransferase TrmD [Anaerocolumna sp. MB42-C2]WMJ88292.1 tRNA (guanosine(37)-N1)-methyltransferase TrmD [Anaerocolumna sp. MB42-C2]